jgi:hypothetical protein
MPGRRRSRAGSDASVTASDAFATRYPHKAAWVRDGFVEIGRAGWGTPSFVRALDEGGMVWDGAAHYPSIDAALAALDAGIAAFLAEQGDG